MECSSSIFVGKIDGGSISHQTALFASSLFLLPSMDLPVSPSLPEVCNSSHHPYNNNNLITMRIYEGDAARNSP